MTNQRKIFGALLTLAVSAFGVDHWWLGSGTTANAPPNLPAAHAPAPHRGGNEARIISQRPAKPAPVNRTLAARLSDAVRAELAASGEDEDAVPAPDAFRPSSLWYPAAAAVAPAVPPVPVISPERIAEFRNKHRLTAVMKSSRPAADGSSGGMAIIGGKVYVPGQVIDGFTLVSLGERTAQLNCTGISIELAIDPPDALTSLSGQ